MDFDSNNFDFDPNKVSAIEKKLKDDSYVLIQFSRDHLPNDHHILKNLKNFLIEIIKKLDGQCLDDKEEKTSIVWHFQPIQASSDRKQAEYMALFVLEPDHFSDRQLEIIRLSNILQCLSLETKEK
ncbi:unnamed protein product [Rotaria sp. Silwood2]|nr:unnamed protein product [Rotaria sp. Silwood2]CAF4438508.1 unnamed protein product [Rotaria sp. Silwood2]